jgi:hypothetical protein
MLELRADGRPMAPVATYRVKLTAEGKAPFDHYAPRGKIAPERRFCQSARRARPKPVTLELCVLAT